MNYGRKGVSKRQKSIAAKSAKQSKRIGIRLFKAFLMCAFILLLVACIGGLWFVKKIIDDAPVITADSVRPNAYFSTIYADDEVTELEELMASEANRIYKELSEIPVDLQHAFIAIEDERFYSHNGIDMRGIARATFGALRAGSLNEGASTITQQLLKNSVFNFMEEDTQFERVERKLQEQYLALQLEKVLSKEQILEYYLNMINLGQNTLGVESAAQRYFGKTVSELTLSESAVIAAVTNSPTGFNPISKPEANATRRQKVLGDMLTQEYITQAEHDEALEDDVYSRIQVVNESKTPETPYSYFVDALVEQVLKDLVTAGFTETQAYNKLYRGGLKIISTQSLEIQQICDEEANNPSNYDSNVRWGISYLLTVKRADGNTDNYSSTHLKRYALETYGDNQGLLYSTRERCEEFIAEWRATIAQEGDEYDERVVLSPQPQTSIVLMDQYNGHIKAMVGGRGEKTTSMSLNRAYTGSYRQPGSLFKIIAAYAPAIDMDEMSLGTIIVDEPFNYANGRPVKNWYSGYRGPVTVRKAIEQSMNICAVKTITDITPQVGIDYAKKLGITTLDPVNDNVQALSLGGLYHGVYNFEITAAYAAIANLGVYNEPVLYTKILDHDGNVLLENAGQNSRQALRPSTATLLTDGMQDVITQGTGTRARLNNMPVSGKTGTTSNNIDLWLSAYTPYYTASVWLGFDENFHMNGVRQSHMDIWRSIMSRVHANLPYRDFEVSSDLQRISVCSTTGLLAGHGCPTTTDLRPISSAPSTYCAGHYVEPEPTEDEEEVPTSDEATPPQETPAEPTPTPEPTPEPEPIPTPTPEPEPALEPEARGNSLHLIASSPHRTFFQFNKFVSREAFLSNRT